MIAALRRRRRQRELTAREELLHARECLGKVVEATSARLELDILDLDDRYYASRTAATAAIENIDTILERLYPAPDTDD